MHVLIPAYCILPKHLDIRRYFSSCSQTIDCQFMCVWTQMYLTQCVSRKLHYFDSDTFTTQSHGTYNNASVDLLRWNTLQVTHTKYLAILISWSRQPGFSLNCLQIQINPWYFKNKTKQQQEQQNPNQNNPFTPKKQTKKTPKHQTTKSQQDSEDNSFQVFMSFFSVLHASTIWGHSVQQLVRALEQLLYSCGGFMSTCAEHCR